MPAETSKTASLPSLDGTKRIRRPLRILLTEAYTDANVGSGALVENTLLLLRERFPNAVFRIVAVYPYSFEGFEGAASVPDPFNYPRKKSAFQKAWWIVATFFWMMMVRLQLCLGKRRVWLCASKIRHYRWADWVVSTHAERLKEAFHIDSIYTLFSFRVAHLLGKKVIVFPCTLGPYGFGTRALVNRWLCNVDLLYTRDELSFKLAHEARGLADEKIIACPDVAILQPFIRREEALALIGCDPEDRLVGISVMRWRYIQGNLTRYSNYASYVAEMARVADHLVLSYGVKVVLYPTNYAIHGSTTEDREAVRDIYRAALQKDRIIPVEQFLKPAELKGALACSEVNITTRMHACIFSTGAGVPTLSVNYLYKLREYMTSLGLADYAIDIEQFNAEWMLAAFDKMWNRRAEIRRQIEENMEAKRALLNAEMDRLCDLD